MKWSQALCALSLTERLGNQSHGGHRRAALGGDEIVVRKPSHPKAPPVAPTALGRPGPQSSLMPVLLRSFRNVSGSAAEQFSSRPERGKTMASSLACSAALLSGYPSTRAAVTSRQSPKNSDFAIGASRTVSVVRSACRPNDPLSSW